MRKFFSRVLWLAAALSFLIVPSAFAAVELELGGYHATVVPLVNNKPDYSKATFSRVKIELEKEDVNPPSGIETLTGTLIITGGDFRSGVSETDDGAPNYILYDTDNPNNKDHKSGDTFTLKGYAGSNRVQFEPYRNLSDTTPVRFAGTESNEGMSGYQLSWTFGDGSVVANGSAKIPTLKSTKEQRANFVPYVELITSGNNVTGLTWRIVNPSDPTKAVSSAPGLREVWIEGDRQGWEGEDYEINSGSNLSGTYRGTEPFSIDDLNEIQAGMVVDDVAYSWRFIPNANTPNTNNNTNGNGNTNNNTNGNGNNTNGNNTNSTSSGGDSSSGCDAGLGGVIALAALGFALLKNRKFKI